MSDVLPHLVVAAHGTRSPQGQSVTHDVVEQVRERLSATVAGVTVHEAYVDVQGPELDDVLAGIDADAPTVIVPFLLAGGYHVHVDIPQATKGRSATTITPALGPDVRLVEIVLDRLAQAQVTPRSRLILAPAGSSDERAQADNQLTAQLLAERWSGPVLVGHAAAVDPSVSEVLADVKSAHDEPVTIASYLLAPGYFQDTLAKAGADACTEPLAPDPRLVDIVIDRYRTYARV